MITPREYQLEGVERTRDAIRRGVRRILLVLPTGGGKCLGIGTPVLRYDGTVVPVEDIAAGDVLMGPDSLPRRVLSTTRGTGPLYRITPVKGDPWVCNDAHVLTLVHTETDEVIDVPLPRYLAETRWFRHLHKQFQPPSGVDFPPGNPLPIDPYFLGVWYGDGTHRDGLVAVSKPDPEIKALVEATASQWGMRVSTYISYNGCPTFTIASKTTGKGANALLNAMRSVRGDTARLPYCYLTASRVDRLAFLAGLLDTDGHLAHGYYEIVQKRKGWADDIAFLARSLGLRVTTREKLVNGQTYWRMIISGDVHILPLRIARKKPPQRLQKKVATRTGITVAPIGTGEYAGFELDGDGRFLLGDFTVTHNTVIAAMITGGVVKKRNRILFMAPRREIVEQSRNKLVEFGVPEADIGIIMASVSKSLINRNAIVQVGSVDTLRNRAQLPPADVVFVDEAHHSRAKSYERLLEYYEKAVIIGLTATPIRMDGRSLHPPFDEMIKISSFKELAALGFLVIPRVFSHEGVPDLEGVKTTAGDYQQDQLEKACDKPHLIGDIVKHWLARAEGRSTAVFAAGVEHSKHLSAAFREAGVRADHLDGTTPLEERKSMLSHLNSGELSVVCSMGVLTEGWDCPRVKAIVLGRPTKSLALYLQMVGRGLRPWNGVEAILLDHAGLVLNPKFGPPQKDHPWTLDEKPKEKKEKPPPVEFKKCPSCYLVVGIDETVCPDCGYEWTADPREVKVGEGELREYTAEELENIERLHLRKSIAREVWKRACFMAGLDGWADTASEKAAAGEQAAILNRELFSRWGKRETLTTSQLNEELQYVLRSQFETAPLFPKEPSVKGPVCSKCGREMDGVDCAWCYAKEVLASSRLEPTATYSEPSLPAPQRIIDPATQKPQWRVQIALGNEELPQ